MAREPDARTPIHLIRETIAIGIHLRLPRRTADFARRVPALRPPSGYRELSSLTVERVEGAGSFEEPAGSQRQHSTFVDSDHPTYALIGQGDVPGGPDEAWLMSALRAWAGP